MKFYTLSSFVCGIASLSLIWTCVDSRHTRYTCEGGRSVGDKWFDGCRWCVCQLDGPLCSPASCSDLVAQVPPCENVGSRWRDGCYQCRCNDYGINCEADSSCVILMQREEYQRQILKPGACVDPEDDRCVCGVDGVPSCTAEVIDRNAHPATTIALDFSSRSNYGQHHRNTESKHRVKRRITSREYLKNRYQTRHSYGSRHNKRHKVRSSYEKPYRFYNQIGGYYNYAESEAGYPNRGYHVPHKSNSKRHRNLYNDKSKATWNNDQRTHSNDPDIDYRHGIVNDESRGLQTPKSLLIITNNRCRYGVRWYGGGLRCYCDEDGSITCGDPKFVATRIDGYRLQNALCEEGHAWSDEGACQWCDCKINGVVLCRRSESCPLPFLIQRIKDVFDPEDDNQRSNEFRSEDEDTITPSSSKKTIDRRSGLKSYNRLYGNSYVLGSRRPLDDEDVNGSVDTDGSGDVKTIDLPYEATRNPPLIIDKINDNDDNDKKHTIVIVTECNRGSRWLEDGCKRCRCDYWGRKNCDDKRCPKPLMAPFEYNTVINDPPMLRGKGRPGQRPPVLSSPALSYIRNKPVNTNPPFNKDKPCGRFRVGQRYLIKCNRCVCYPHGPKCTAINCG